MKLDDAISKGCLADDLLEILRDKIEVSTDDYGRKEVSFTPGAKAAVLAWIDWCNDSINPFITSEWLTDEAKLYAEQNLTFSINPAGGLSRPVAASFLSEEGQWLTGFGKTPLMAIKDAYARTENLGTGDEPAESRSSALLRQPLLNFHG